MDSVDGRRTKRNRPKINIGEEKQGGTGSFPWTAQQCLELVSDCESLAHQKVIFKEHKDLMETWPLTEEELKIDRQLLKHHPHLDLDQRHNLIRGYSRFTMEEMLTAAEDIDYWNKQYGSDILYSPITKRDRTFYTAFVEVIHGTDKWGHPVSSIDFSSVDHAKLASVLKDPKTLIRIQSRKLLASAYLKHRISKVAERRVRKNIFIMDLDGISLYTFYKHKDVVKGIMEVGLKYFPETLLKVYLVNPSRVFYMVWSVAKWWLDPVTLSNTHVVKDLKLARRMWEEDGIKVNTLPTKLGGKGIGSVNMFKIVKKVVETSAMDVQRQRTKVETKKVPVHVPLIEPLTLISTPKTEPTQPNELAPPTKLDKDNDIVKEGGAVSSTTKKNEFGAFGSIEAYDIHTTLLHRNSKTYLQAKEEKKNKAPKNPTSSLLSSPSIERPSELDRALFGDAADDLLGSLPPTSPSPTSQLDNARTTWLYDKNSSGPGKESPAVSQANRRRRRRMRKKVVKKKQGSSRSSTGSIFSCVGVLRKKPVASSTSHYAPEKRRTTPTASTITSSSSSSSRFSESFISRGFSLNNKCLHLDEKTKRQHHSRFEIDHQQEGS
mmetsp:Transcript_38049/g.61100  ORF Transcript_38049/g.61100 Transcript_38049/m.61100 type:complete len:605 (-) Transcript_38049:224-2038(-)